MLRTIRERSISIKGMSEFYSEDEFYKDNGWPSETLKYREGQGTGS